MTPCFPDPLFTQQTFFPFLFWFRTVLPQLYHIQLFRMLSTLPSHPSFPNHANPQICQMATSPFKSRRRVEHERHGSMTIQQSRPMSMMSYPTPQHSKRASIYVSDASIILAQRAPMISPTSSYDSLSSPGSETSDFADHYSIMQLGPEASDEDITSSFRRLRAVYFQSDATKYKALTAAFDLLRDPEARRAYDMEYHSRSASPSLSLSSTGDYADQPKHQRTDSAMGDEAAKLAVLKEEEEEELEATRRSDPNWGLKRHQSFHEPPTGMIRRQSYIPVPTAPDARRDEPPPPPSRRQSFIPQMARNSRFF